MTTTNQQFTVKTLKILLLEEQSEIAYKYPNLELKGDVKITKHWSNPSKTSFGIFFDLIEDAHWLSQIEILRVCLRQLEGGFWLPC